LKISMNCDVLVTSVCRSSVRRLIIVQIGRMVGDPRCTLANLYVIFKVLPPSQKCVVVLPDPDFSDCRRVVSAIMLLCKRFVD